MKSKILLLTLALVFSLAVSAQTTVPALITTNQTWTSSGSPYLISQNTYIDTNASVKVGPGVTIEFTGSYKLIIDGEFQAVGNSSSGVYIKNAQFDFRDGCADYNDSTGAGAIFEYCTIKGNGSTGGGIRTIAYRNTSMKVSYCSFDSTHYSIYGNSSTVANLTVDHSTFQGFPSGYIGYPIYSSGSKNNIKITDCGFYNAYGIYAYGLTLFENNEVVGLNAVTGYLYEDAVIKCNTFKLMENGLQIQFYGSSSSGNNPSLDLSFNTFDSIGATSNNSMLKIARSSATYGMGTVAINYNNFLNEIGGAYKVAISGTNQSPTSSQTINFYENWWGTTDTSYIDSFIHDYNDDITIFGSVAYTPILNQPQTGCSYIDPCPTADFVVSQDDTVLVFYDSSTAINGYTMNWYVDGTYVGNGAVFTYVESTPGTYTMCLRVSDTITNCVNVTCKTFTISGSSTSCQASYYLAIDTNNLYNLYIVDNSTGTTSTTNYTWSFGDGSGSSATNPTHQYSSFGLYLLCLTIEDSAAGCYSTYCDSIGLDSNGAVLKSAAFSITVINESDLLSARSIDFVSDFDMYPNPTTGELKLSVNSKVSDEMQIVVFNTIGIEVFTKDVLINGGSNKISIDLSNQLNGMYIVQLRSGNGMVTKRVLLSK